MTPEQIVTIIVGILNAGAISTFAWHLIRGLNAKIVALEGTIAQQNQTLTVMERRIAETEKIGELYKSMLSSLPEDLEKFKSVLSKTSQFTIEMLEAANKQKEEQLRQFLAEESSKGGSKKSKLHLKIGQFLLEKENEHFRGFIEHLYGKPELAVQELLSAQTFEELAASDGRKLTIDESNRTAQDVWKELQSPGSVLVGASNSLWGDGTLFILMVE